MRFVKMSGTQARAVMTAMKAVATANGTREFSPAEAALLEGAREHVLDVDDPLADVSSTVPSDLASILDDPDLRRQAVAMMAMMPYADGQDPVHTEVQVVEDAAAALGIDEPYIKDLHKAAKGHWVRVAIDYGRRQAKDQAPGVSAWRNVWETLQNQKGWKVDWDLAHRYHKLGLLPEGSFGRAFWTHYVGNGFYFPGERYNMGERIIVPHDCTHVLSGYDTSPQGEILVMAFTTGYEDRNAMDFAMMLVMQFHVGRRIDPDAGTSKGNLEPDSFWNAIERGAAMNRNLTDPDFDWWSLMDAGLDEVRREFDVPAAPADHLARPGMLATST